MVLKTQPSVSVMSNTQLFQNDKFPNGQSYTGVQNKPSWLEQCTALICAVNT